MKKMTDMRKEKNGHCLDRECDIGKQTRETHTNKVNTI